jgi:hypothetical protein
MWGATGLLCGNVQLSDEFVQLAFEHGEFEEAAACLVWAKCLQVWLHQPTLHPSRIRYFFLVAALYAGVLLANTFSALIHETSDFFVVSVVGTMTSAMIVIFMRNKRQLAHANIRQVNPAQLM